MMLLYVIIIFLYVSSFVVSTFWKELDQLVEAGLILGGKGAKEILTNRQKTDAREPLVPVGVFQFDYLLPFVIGILRKADLLRQP